MIRDHAEIRDDIKRCFNKAADSYDQNCYIQQEIANALMLRLEKFQFVTNAIADFGCGTGMSTEQFAKSYLYDIFFAIDISDQFIEKAKVKLQHYNIKPLVADLEKAIFEKNSLDFAFANMSLQWCLQLPKTLAIMFEQLSDTGILAFSLPIYGTFKELRSESVNEFHSNEEIRAMLQDTNFKILDNHVESFIAEFDSPLAALKSIKKAGANCLVKQDKRGLSGKSFLQTIFPEVAGNEAQYNLTYKIALFIAEK